MQLFFTNILKFKNFHLYLLKLNTYIMKPFNLERALAGDPVVTRDGRTVTNVTHFEGANRFCLAAIIHPSNDPFAKTAPALSTFSKTGSYYSLHDSVDDLFMASVKKELWTNVYISNIGKYVSGGNYENEAEAREAGKEMVKILGTGVKYVKSVKVFDYED